MISIILYTSLEISLIFFFKKKVVSVEFKMIRERDKNKRGENLGPGGRLAPKIRISLAKYIIITIIFPHRLPLYNE
jgi:hypothetical protein